MARSINQISRVFLPGTGFVGATGAPSNLKALAVFKVNITSYTTGGESVKPADLGFSAVDFLIPFAASANATQPAGGTGLIFSNWDNVNNLLIVNSNSTTQLTSTQAAVIFVLAYGDGLADAVAL